MFFVSTAFCDHSYFSNIKKQLIKDGFKPDFIDKIYKPSKVKFDFKSSSLFFTISEHKLDYKNFISKKNIKKINAYIKKHNDVFKRAYKRYNVPSEVIASIILVETRLGQYTGSRNILSVLSSIAAIKSAHVRKMVRKSISTVKNRYSFSKFNSRGIKKSKFAYKELKAFLKFCITNGVKPYNIKGSYAGAYGIPQFMPSNIILYGKDGNNDDLIDLSLHDDAIMSTANYLKSHGWTKNLKEDIARKVIKKYNNSVPYIDTVLELSKRAGDKK